MIHLDTHVVVWAYLGDLARLAPVRAVLDTATLGISPMARLELQYLHEIGRLRVPAAVVVAELAETLGLESTDASFAAVTTVAAGIAWTRDPFDRLIVANAIVDGVPLLTRDETMRAHFVGARWGG